MDEKLLNKLFEIVKQHGKKVIDYKIYPRLLFGLKTSVKVLIVIYAYHCISRVTKYYFGFEILEIFEMEDVRKVFYRSLAIVLYLYLTLFFFHVYRYIFGKSSRTLKLKHLKKAFSQGLLNEKEYKTKTLDIERQELLEVLIKLKESDSKDVANIESFFDLVNKSHRIDGLLELIENSYNSGIISKEEYEKKSRLLKP